MSESRLMLTGACECFFGVFDFAVIPMAVIHTVGCYRSCLVRYDFNSLFFF